MQNRRRTVVLASILVALIAAGAVAAWRGGRPSSTVVIQDPAAASARERRERALAALPPARSLGTPASTQPDKLTRTSLALANTAADLPGAGEGLVTTIEITSGKFDIVRRYRSMEGPYATYKIRADGAAAIADAGSHSPARELWWWKGAKIEVLDMDDRPVGQEFMCHLNIDVNSGFRSSVVGMKLDSTRLLTLTQGELSFALPKGLGVPVASDEPWSLMFQVLNHNRDGEFHVRQRLTLYFVRDADLFAPIEPSRWHAASIWVPVDKSSPDAIAFDKTTCHCCSPPTRGLEATNNIGIGRSVDGAGRVIVGHWTVPPGTSTWTSAMKGVTATLGRKDQRLHATWTHLHPFATQARLSAHKPGCAPITVARSDIESLRDGRVGLVGIKSLASVEGVALPDDAEYELAVDYDNTSGRPQDSMTSLGMFLKDDAWVRPAWAARAQNTSGMDASCGVGP